VLDVGFAGAGLEEECGLAHMIIREVNKGSLVVGIDVNREYVKRCLLKYPTFENVILGDAFKLPFQDQTFDAVFIGELLEHIWKPIALLEETYRVIKRKGKLYLTTPNPFDLVKFIRYLVKGKFNLGSPEHKMLYDPLSVSNMLRYIGFRNVEFTTVNLRFYIPLLKRTMKFDTKSRLFSKVGLITCVNASK
jgi:ubiquinone/menaquinone biosynthesis C-methylase UbiE